jgi:hypothetical protein
VGDWFHLDTSVTGRASGTPTPIPASKLIAINEIGGLVRRNPFIAKDFLTESSFHGTYGPPTISKRRVRKVFIFLLLYQSYALDGFDRPDVVATSNLHGVDSLPW